MVSAIIRAILLWRFEDGWCSGLAVVIPTAGGHTDCWWSYRLAVVISGQQVVDMLIIKYCCKSIDCTRDLHVVLHWGGGGGVVQGLHKQHHNSVHY